MADLCGIKNLIGPAGMPAIGTVERLSGVAKFLTVEARDCEATYEGTTEIWWDDQRTAFGRAAASS